MTNPSLDVLSDSLKKADKYDALTTELKTKLDTEISKAVLGLLNTPAVRKMILEKAMKEIQGFLEDFDVREHDDVTDRVFDLVGQVVKKNIVIKGAKKS